MLLRTLLSPSRKSSVLFLSVLVLARLSLHGTWSFMQQMLKPQVVESTELYRRLKSNSFSHGNFSLTWMKSFEVPTPSYVQILERDKLSVTSFSLLRKGAILQYKLNSNADIATDPILLNGNYLWPNELSTFRGDTSNDILLIPDGFLMPGQNNGGIYALVNPNDPLSTPIRLTKPKEGWFYHRAIYLELPTPKGHVRGILTARATKPILGKGEGELVFLPLPLNYERTWRNDEVESKYLDEVVLAYGPDVMFEVFDLNPLDDTLQVIAAHFFNNKLSIHTLRGSDYFPFVEVIHSEEIDTEGKPYGLCLANLDAESSVSISTKSLKVPKRKLTQAESNEKFSCPTHILVTTHECNYDFPSAIEMAFSTVQGEFPKVLEGKYIESSQGTDRMCESSAEFLTKDDVLGGSLLVYKIPDRIGEVTRYREGSLNKPKKQRQQLSKIWSKKSLFGGFKVRGWGGIFSPGAPGFPYIFKMPNQAEAKPPIILLAGDCTGSAYIFAPSNSQNGEVIYDLAFEVQCGATVGSVAFSEQKDGSVDLFIPAYELNKIHIFKLKPSE